MRVLYIGGTGEISQACVTEASNVGHDVTIFNRGKRLEALPSGVEQVLGDFRDDSSYEALAKREFDVVCQFLAYDKSAVQRDIELFTGRCGHYIFVSTASAYQKPCRSHVITENTPLDNPYWAYSRSKADCETLLNETDSNSSLNVTIVRPSHTYRTKFPSTVIDGDHLAWRLLHDKPVIVHGDGESLWTLTHSTDFANAFVKLCGNSRAFNETVHITSSQPNTWNEILRSVSLLLGKEPDIHPVTSNTLVRYNPDWTGPLLGDKSNTVVFDNSKISTLVGDWQCRISLPEGLKQVNHHVRNRLDSGYQPDGQLDRLIDQIILEQERVGR